MELTREAVPRRYAWTEFRSTLEADWAANLDHLGIKWEYEQTKFTLPSGTWYLPDFHLPEIGTWIEVKGPDVPGLEKPRELAKAFACHCEGTCECAFPGGEIVLIGLRSQPAYGMRYGTLAWASTIGFSNALLGRCDACGKHSWVRLRVSLACRHCKADDAFEHLAAPGEVEFRKSTEGTWPAFGDLWPTVPAEGTES